MRTSLDVSTTRKAFVHVFQTYEAAKWELPSDFLEYSHYERVVREHITWQSSPGYPYLLEAPTNEVFFGVVNGVPSEEALRRVYQLVASRIQEGGSDPIRLFIKPEPHKIKKLEKGAYRLISSVSVVDQIIDHMLFAPMNDAMIENHLNLPAKIGWSPMKGGWKILPVNWMSLDKSAWDWSMMPWLIQQIHGLREQLCVNKNSQKFKRWQKVSQMRYQQLYDKPLFVTSQGFYLRQINPGVQKSGCVNTISDNSIAQDFLHAVACIMSDQPITPQWSMGDDTYTKPPQDLRKYLEVLQQFCHLKFGAQGSEFAGFRYFEGGYVEPMYRGKHAFNILHLNQNFAEEFVNSYTLLYHRSTLSELMREFLGRVSTPPLSQWCDDIFDGED